MSDGIVIGRKGTQIIPISDPTVSRAHCKVTPNGDGTYTVENLSAAGTFVDGIEIVRTKASSDSVIRLGQSFTVTLRDLIVTSAPVFKISHLRNIWEDFDNENIALAEKNRSVNLVRTVTPIFTIVAMLMSSVWNYSWILVGVGAFAIAYGFLCMKNAETPTQRKERNAAFEEKWICPNPDCGKYLPKVNYKQLIRNYSSSCPYCKCKYVE